MAITSVNGTAHADDFSPVERLGFEKELLGFYVSGHPMATYAGLAEAIDTFAVEDLTRQGDRTEFRLCGIVSGIVKKLSKKDNRPWAAFTLATREASVALNMFADAYAAQGTVLAENGLVVVQGNIIAGNDGPRINVKECYPLDAFVAGQVRAVTWLLRPAHPELPAFLRRLRDILDAQVGDTKVAFAFLFEERVAPVAEVSGALAWKLNAPTFQELRAHPAVAGVQLETKPLELKQDRRWSRK
jgi:DNA polymerase-3 subunit alpha